MPAIHISTFETRCSFCESNNTVTAEALRARAGLIACDDCGQTFNAAWNLVDQIPHPAAALESTRYGQSKAPYSQQNAASLAGPQPAHSDHFEASTGQIDDDLSATPSGKLEPRLRALDDPVIEERADLDLSTRPAPTNAVRRARWPAAGLALALAALFIQLRFTLLDEIASVPGARPYVAVFCRYTGCELPQSLDGPAIAVTRSEMDLHRTQPDALVVRIHLINRSQEEQVYPSLEISLHDSNGQLLARRTYLPDEFGVEASQRIGGEREALVTLVLAQVDSSTTGLTARAVRS